MNNGVCPTRLALVTCLALLATLTLSADEVFDFTTAGTIGANDETAGAADSALNSSNTPVGYPSLSPVTINVSDGLYCNPCTLTLTTGPLDAPLINGGSNYQQTSPPYAYQIPYSTAGGSFTLTNTSGTVFSGSFVPATVIFDLYNGGGGLQGFLGDASLNVPVYVSGTFGPASPYSGDAVSSSSFLELSFSSLNVFSWSAGYPGGGADATFQANISDATSGPLESELVLDPLVPSPVPEPASWILIGSVLIGLACGRRLFWNPGRR
jgi:hypothetical protein